jgi:hypothetical protein
MGFLYVNRPSGNPGAGADFTNQDFGRKVFGQIYFLELKTQFRSKKFVSPIMEINVGFNRTKIYIYISV